MITELREQIGTVLATVTGASGVYYREAPQDAELPYIVFGLVANPNNKDTGNTYEENRVQFSIFGEKLSDIEPISTDLKDKIGDPANYSFSTHTLIVISKDFENDFKVENVWQINIQYFYEIVRN